MKSMSIIIPVYNSEKYIYRCLKSVSELNYPVKVLLIDDGSTDQSGEICEMFKKKDDRFTVVHQKNMGLVSARERGIQLVDTDFFTFIDSDDYIDSIKYDNILFCSLCEQNEQVDIICTGLVEEYLGQKSYKKNCFPDGIYFSKRLEEMIYHMLSGGPFFAFGILPNAVCKIYRTDFVRRSRYWISPEVKIGEDADMTFQLMLMAEKVMVCNGMAYHYCRREGSMMSDSVSTQSINCLENDLRKAFYNARYDKERLLEQLNDYIDFINLLCNPSKALGRLKFFLSKTDRIAIYGAGGVGKAVRYGLDNRFTLWVDQDYKFYNNDMVTSIDTLFEKNDEYDKIFIAISNIEICKRILSELRGRGIDKPIFYFRYEDEE